jgi:cytochrome oxidase Cu insertion factor (SCO1/SenC/PrrC family)
MGSVSTVARTLNFVLTAKKKDNAAQGTAQTNSDNTVITVSGTAGPFAVTSQNTENLSWLQGTEQTITWA